LFNCPAVLSCKLDSLFVRYPYLYYYRLPATRRRFLPELRRLATCRESHSQTMDFRRDRGDFSLTYCRIHPLWPACDRPRYPPVGIIAYWSFWNLSSVLLHEHLPQAHQHFWICAPDHWRSVSLHSPDVVFLVWLWTLLVRTDRPYVSKANLQ